MNEGNLALVMMIGDRNILKLSKKDGSIPRICRAGSGDRPLQYPVARGVISCLMSGKIKRIRFKFGNKRLTLKVVDGWK